MLSLAVLVLRDYLGGRVQLREITLESLETALGIETSDMDEELD